MLIPELENDLFFELLPFILDLYDVPRKSIDWNIYPIFGIKETLDPILKLFKIVDVQYEDLRRLKSSIHINSEQQIQFNLSISRIGYISELKQFVFTEEQLRYIKLDRL